MKNFYPLIRLGSRLAIAVGLADVAIALLQRPEGFASLAAIGPAAAATTVAVLVIFLATVSPVRWLGGLASVEPESIAAAWAATMGTAIVVALLSGVQASFGPSPQVLFKLAAAAVLGVAVGAGAYAINARKPGPESQLQQAIVVTLPLLLFFLLVAEWAAVYAIDSLASIAGAIVLGALGVAAVVILTAGLAAPASREWSLAPLAGIVALIVVPMAAGAWPEAEPSLQAASPPAGRPKRIVLITVDTLRADAVSAYRPGAQPTPAIDALAADGLLFERAFAPAPWTLPALSSILTGLAPAVHQAVDFTSRLSRNSTTLAEHLRNRGYRTAAIVHNDLLIPARNLSQGFTDYQDLEEPWYAESVGATLLQGLLPRQFPPRGWPSTADHTDVALRWIARHQHEPFFLWLHYLDPHAPYAPPSRLLARPVEPAIGASFEGQKLSMEGVVVPTPAERRWIRSLYDSEVRYVDENVGRLVEALRRLGLYDDTVIVLTSDHGEEFWEHGALGHGHTMFSEVLQVPLIVRAPGTTTRRARVPATVSTVSVTPTILDAAGIDYSPADVSAPSLFPALSGQLLEDTPVVSTAQMLFDRRETVRFANYRYVVSRIDGAEELFDLASDPGETQSVARSNPDALAAGRQLLETHLAEAHQLGRRLGIVAASAELDAEMQRRLRSLGYIR